MGVNSSFLDMFLGQDVERGNNKQVHCGLFEFLFSLGTIGKHNAPAVVGITSPADKETLAE